MTNNDQATDVLWEEVLVSQIQIGDCVRWQGGEATVEKIEPLQYGCFLLHFRYNGNSHQLRCDSVLRMRRGVNPALQQLTPQPLPFSGILHGAALSDAVNGKREYTYDATRHEATPPQKLPLIVDPEFRDILDAARQRLIADVAKQVVAGTKLTDVSGTSPNEATLPQQTRKEIERQHSECVAKRLTEETPYHSIICDTGFDPKNYAVPHSEAKNFTATQQTAESATVTAADLAAAIQKPPLPVVEEKCRNCRFWKLSYEMPYPNDGDAGRCRRRPLSVEKTAGDWCGEYEAAATRGGR